MAKDNRKPGTAGTPGPDPRTARGQGHARATHVWPDGVPRPRGDLPQTEEVYWRGWSAYLREPKTGAVRAALGCMALEAERLVRHGMPSLGLPGYSPKMAGVVTLAAQMDADEGARAVALGRGLLRTAQAKLGTALAGRTFGPATLSDRDYLAALVTVQKRVELTATDPDQEQQRLRAEESLGKALGGLLEAVVKRLMPNVGDALPTVEDLEALDLPLLTDGEVTEADIVEGDGPNPHR